VVGRKLFDASFTVPQVEPFGFTPFIVQGLQSKADKNHMTILPLLLLVSLVPSRMHLSAVTSEGTSRPDKRSCTWRCKAHIVLSNRGRKLGVLYVDQHVSIDSCAKAFFEKRVLETTNEDPGTAIKKLQELLGNTGAALRNTLKHNIPGTENG
jgi:hypothetical protein